MERMKKIRDSLNRPAKGRMVTAIVGIIGICVPAYLLRGTDWSKVQFSVLGVLLPLLYIIAVIALMFAAAGAIGPRVTSRDTDQKIVSGWNVIQKKLTPLYRLAGIALLAWILYLIWCLRQFILNFLHHNANI